MSAPLVPTVASLRRQQRRVDRRRTGAARILADMRVRGLTLHLQFSPQGPTWALSDGTGVSAEVAQIITSNPAVIDCGGALFRNLPGQVFRFAED